MDRRNRKYEGGEHQNWVVQIKNCSNILTCLLDIGIKVVNIYYYKVDIESKFVKNVDHASYMVYELF